MATLMDLSLYAERPSQRQEHQQHSQRRIAARALRNNSPETRH